MFNPFTFLRLGGLLPGFAGLSAGALGGLVARFGTTFIAARLAITMLRTAGFLSNQTGFLPGLPVRSTPQTRILTLPLAFLPFGLGTFGMTSFLSGFAFRDREELADGWLSFFGEFLLQDVPLVDTSTEKAIDALNAGNFATFGIEAADAFSQAVGLQDVVAFFNGVAQIERDFREAGLPTAHPAPWVFGGALAVFSFLDSLFRRTGETLGGAFEPDAPPLDPEVIKGFQEDAEKLGRALREADTTLPTTEGGVKRAIQTIRRLIRRGRASRDLLRAIKDSDPTGSQREKVEKAFRRAFR